MADIAATFGTGTLLVLQPSTTDPIALRVALGIQRLWAQWLRDAGRRAVRTVAVGRLERLTDAHGVDATSDAFAVGDKFVAHFVTPQDAELGPLVAAYSARWGLQSAFELDGPAFRLGTRLFEVRDGVAHALDEHAFDGELMDLPGALFDVVRATTQRTGVRAPWQHWSEAFTTGDPEAALHYLAAVGTWTMVEEGARMTVADAFEPVVRALSRRRR